MAGKSYIKIGSNNWDRIKKMYVKTGGQTWTAIRKAYVKTNSGWQKVFDTASNRPFIRANDIPKIRLNTFRTNSTYDPTGTVNDPVNPVVEAPPVQQMGPPTTTPTVGWPSGTIGNHLWGYDGDWVSGNGSTMTFVYDWLYNLTGNRNDNTLETGATSSTGRADMLTNSSTHLGQSDGDYFDKNFLTFRVTATNSAGPASFESAQVYIVRQRPSGTINLINTSVDVPETLSASFTYANQWYNKPDLVNSYIEWFAIDSAGEALTTSNRVAIEYLNSVVTTGTTTKSGTVYHNATLANKIYSVRITLNNSNTQAPVIPISGFTPNSAFTAEDSTSPGSALEVTSLDILDYYSNEGTDNRGYIPVGGLMKIRSNVTGVDGSTTYRIRYRMYNWQDGSYYGMDGTNYGASANSAWTTRTGSSTSFGFGGTLINEISVSGTTATLTHNEVISSSLFGSTTFSGGQDRWSIEIEVSALKNSVRKYYADVVGGIPYYVSRPATLSLTASPENAQVNETVTLSGSVSALGGGNSYPRQYKIDFGDGTADSGWLPVGGGYSYGTSNPSFSITKQYSAVGEYYPNVRTIPDYSSATAYVNVSAALTAPTSTSIVSMSRLNDTTVRAVIGSSGGSGPYYQLYWIASASAPVTANYDAAGTTSTVTEDFGFANATTYYFYMRSSSQNLGNTVNNGTATAGTFSAYGPSSGAASYTFAQPSGSVSVSPSSGTAGTTQFTATASVSAAPAASISYQWKYRDQGSTFLAIAGATSSTYTPPSNYVALYGGSLRCDIVANNGVGTQLVANSGTVTVNAALAKLATPTNVNATDTRTDGVNVTWTAVAGAAYYGVWYGGAPAYDSLADFGGNRDVNLITGTSYLDTAISAGSSRDYYVQAYRSNDPTGTKSEWGGPNNGTRVAAPTKLSTPTGVSASDNRSDGINITWNAVSGASYYGIWWGGVPSYDNAPDFGGPNNAGGWNGFGTSFLDTQVSSGTTRNYYVQAFASGNPTGTKSDWSAGDSGTRTAGVSAPSAPTGVNTSGSGLVTWSASSGATGYTVEYYTATSSSGANQTGPYYGFPGNSTSFQISYPVVDSVLQNWARARVLASNSGGDSSYSGFSPASGFA
jgi:hypothetical protein